MPDIIRAGQTIKYTRTITDFPADQGWTLAVYLRGAVTRDAAVSTNANGKDFDVTVPATGATGTEGMTAGNYAWIERVSKAGEVYDFSEGTLLVLQNLATAAAGDGQSLNEKLLALVETRLSGRMTEDMEQFSIAGRAISRIPFKELMSIRNSLRWSVWQERNPGVIGRQALITFEGPEMRP